MQSNNHTINAGNVSKPPPKASVFTQLLVNILIPVLILVFLKKDSFVGALFDDWITDPKTFNKLAFIIALAFPIGYGVKDFFDRRKVNFFSVIGTVNIALTGGMGLLEFPPSQIAIKEAAVPGLIGLAILISIKTPFPLVKSIIFNPQIMDVDKIESSLDANNARKAFEKTLTTSTLIVAGSSFLAAVTNYFLAIIVLQSQPGTEQFNDEMARMIALSYPVNALPAAIITMFAFYYTYKNIRKFTGLTMEEVLNLPDELKDEDQDKEKH